jgi:hypothetical protein
MILLTFIDAVYYEVTCEAATQLRVQKLTEQSAAA